MAKNFTPERISELEEILTHFPNKRAALLPALRLAEEEFGYLDAEACSLVANHLDLTPATVWGVMSFYTHYKREWHGKYRIMVCGTLMCALRNCEGIIEHIKNKLKIDIGERTADGNFSLEKVECLASCGTAPALQINDVHYENLSIEKVDEILNSLK